MVFEEIHSLCWFFFFPRTSSHVSSQSVMLCSHCVSMLVSLSSINSCRGWNRLERLILKSVYVYLLLSSPSLNFFRALLLILVYLLSRSLTAVTSRWLSEETSAPLITRTSRHDLLNFWLIQMWSIWFSVTWSGDLQVTLWMRLCEKMLPPTTSWFIAHKSANLSPFSFICPSLFVPMMSSYPVFIIIS